MSIPHSHQPKGLKVSIRTPPPSGKTPRVLFDTATDAIDYVNDRINDGWTLTRNTRTHIYLSKGDDRLIVIVGNLLRCIHCNKLLYPSIRDVGDVKPRKLNSG
jgi:hypothetical protein